MNDVGQCLAVNELHGVEVDAAFAAGGEDGDDVGVVQLRGGVSFVLEALQLPGIERAGEGEDFQGDPPAERDLLGLVDDAHAAPADLADDAEIAQNSVLRSLTLPALTPVAYARGSEL